MAFVPTAVEPGISYHRCTIVDLLGSGFSDKPTGFDYSPEQHASTPTGFR